jgi:cyclic pyranopterin phosphate synthase
VSLDALDDEIFRTMNDANVPVARVLGGIEAARQAGFGPIKINMVVRRGINESQILPMAEYCRATGDVLRFIEFMDVGTTNRWNLTEVMPAADILDMLSSRWPMEPLSPVVHGEVAERYAYADGATEIGIISSVTRPFCSTCVRARLSAKGELFTCLFAASGHDLRAPLRSGANEEELSLLVGNIWRGRADRYSELRSSISKPRSKVEMSYIGG